MLTYRTCRARAPLSASSSYQLHVPQVHIYVCPCTQYYCQIAQRQATIAPRSTCFLWFCPWFVVRAVAAALKGNVEFFVIHLSCCLKHNYHFLKNVAILTINHFFHLLIINYSIKLQILLKALSRESFLLFSTKSHPQGTT